MTARTVLLDLMVRPTDVTDLAGRSLLKSTIVKIFKEVLGKIEVIKELNNEDSFFLLITGPQDSIMSVRGYTDGTLTVNIDFYKKDCKDDFLTYQSALQLKEILEKELQAFRSCTLVPLKRGGFFERYFSTADERLLEYDVDQLVYETQSPYQKIQIFHSKSLGNMLVLDDNQNMSEADLIYTETLIQRGKESYEGKEIVILGGGDGGLLCELLKENPKYVTMLELDEKVVSACSRYMRGVCGDCLDKKKGDNYEIIIGDCLVTLKKMVDEGRKYDYVFGDLTEIPISNASHGNDWDAMKHILNVATRIVKPGSGKFMTHGNSAALPEALSMYEEELHKLCLKVTFTKDIAYIPSFYEDWVFYQISVV